jgi:ketosteroid isomerase-like protein
MPALAAQIEAQIAAIRATYDALNRNDIAGAIAPFAEDIDWIEPFEYTGSESCHGRAAVEAHLTKARATWAEGSCNLEQLLPIGDKIVVTIRVHVRLKTETQFREGRHAAVYTFCNGKATEMRIIDDVQQAIAWAEAQAAQIDPPKT